MTCAELDARLVDVLAGTVSAEDRAALEAHATGCARCADVLAAGVETPVLLRSLGPATPPPDLAERAFRAALAAPEIQPDFLDSVFRWASVLAPVAVAAAVLVSLSGSSSNGEGVDAAAGILGDSSGWIALEDSEVMP